FAFVPTAAGPDAEEQVWVQGDREQLAALGCDVFTLELASAAPEDVDAALAESDGVFLTGGDSYLLLWHTRRSGFADRVIPLVEAGRLIYAGTSAGAVIAGPDLAPLAGEDDPSAFPELESSEGLGLVGFIILPHDGDPEHVARYDGVIAAHP